MNLTTKRSLKVIVNNKPYHIEVDNLTASPLTVKVNGRPYQVEIDLAPSAPIPQVEPPPAPEKVSKPAAGIETTAKTVTAPLPGHIVAIAVKPGDAVSLGQELCSLEAMKMKNAIRSPHNGVIAEVKVRLGQAVAHGDVLLTFQ